MTFVLSDTYVPKNVHDQRVTAVTIAEKMKHTVLIFVFFRYSY